MDALALPRCSSRAFSAAPSPPPTTVRRGGFSLFRGLKPSPIISLRSPTSLPISKRSSRIVCEAQDTAVTVSAATEATWKSLVLECEIPVLVEFWAPWCGPCRMIHPIVDELAKEYAGKVKFYKVNTDDNPAIATQYGIRSIPTVIVFKGGEKIEAIIGAVPRSTLATCVDKYL